MSGPGTAREAVVASQRLLDRGELAAAQAVLEGHLGDARVELQRGAIAAEAVWLDGGDAGMAVAILTPYIDGGRALDLIGTAHYHAAITTADHTLSEAVGECTSASRLPFDLAEWRTANLLHIGMIQQRQGAHDIAFVYLQDAYTQSEDWPSERATAALHLGLDADARGDEATAVRFIEESLDVRRLAAQTAAIPASLLALAAVVSDSRFDRAGKLIDEAVEVGRSLRVRRPLAHALFASGRHHRRRAELHEARTIAAELGDRILLSLIED